MGSPLGISRRARPAQPGGKAAREGGNPGQHGHNEQGKPPHNKEDDDGADHSQNAVLDKVLETMREGVMLCDSKGIIEDMNTSLCTMFGWAREELTGAHINLLLPAEVAAEHDKYMADFYANVLSGRVALEATKVGALRLLEGKRKSGELFPIQLTVIPVQGTLGEDSLRLVAYIRDITHVVEAEESLAEATREQQMREMAQYMLGYVNHELRNPLQGVQGLVGLLLEQLDDLEPSRKNRPGQVEAILDDLDALDGLMGMLERVVDDMQELRQVEETDLVVAPVPTTVNAPLNAAAQLFSRSCSAKQERVAFECRLLPQDTPVVVDPNRVVQVLGNFLSNAVKYTDAGQVTLGVEITEGHGCKGACVRYFVRDTGRGIPPHKLEDVFHPYQQVLASDARLFGGTGLGLHLCKRIADKLRGGVGVTSEVGKGSEFFLWVPLVAPHTGPVVELGSEGEVLVMSSESGAPSTSRLCTNWDWIPDTPSSVSPTAGRKGKRRPKNKSNNKKNKGKNKIALATWASETALVAPNPPKSPTRNWGGRLARGLGSKLAALPHLRLDRPSQSPGAIVPPHTRFLVVDGGDLNRSILARMLCGLGAAEVLEASDGPQALEVLEQCRAKVPHHHIAAVFMDLVMEGAVGGVEATRKIRQRGFAVPVVGVSSDVSASLKQEASEAGVCKVLTKPCRLITFRQCLLELQIAG